MSDTVLSEIIKTEQEAARIDEESGRQAREMIADAGREAAQVHEKSISECEAVSAAILEAAREEAQADILSHEESFNKARADFTRRAGMNLEKAVQLIFGRIVDLSGHR